MSTDEALWRLSQFGQGSLGDFIGLSQDDIANHPRAFLLKHYSVKQDVKRRIPTKAQSIQAAESSEVIEVVTEYIRFELHDPQTAIRELIRYHETASKAGQAAQVLNELPMMDELINRMLAAGMNPEEVFNRMLGKLRVEQDAIGDGH